MEQGIAFEEDYIALNYTRGIAVKSSKLGRAAAETAAHIAEIEAEGHLPGAQPPAPADNTNPASDDASASHGGGVHHFFGGNRTNHVIGGVGTHAEVAEGHSGGDANGAERAEREPAQRKPLAREAPAIFQATFMEGGAVAKADVIEYVGGGEWDIVEVKSCSDRHVEGYLLDLSFTVYMATRAGLNVRRAYLVAVSSNYRFGMPRRTVGPRLLVLARAIESDSCSTAPMPAELASLARPMPCVCVCVLGGRAALARPMFHATAARMVTPPQHTQTQHGTRGGTLPTARAHTAWGSRGGMSG